MLSILNFKTLIFIRLTIDMSDESSLRFINLTDRLQRFPQVDTLILKEIGK